MLRPIYRAMLLLMGCACAQFCHGAPVERLSVTDFGARPNSQKDSTPAIDRALAALQHRHSSTLFFPHGRYDFWPGGAPQRHYFISNHDPVNLRRVVMPLESLHNVTVDGDGSTFMFHGTALPIAITKSSGIRLKNFSIDDATPHQVSGVVLRTSDENADIRIDDAATYAVQSGQLWIIGDHFRSPASASLLFDAHDRGMAWHTGDNWEFARTRAEALDAHTVRLRNLKQTVVPGQILLMWSGDRPNPAVFVYESRDVNVSDVTVHSTQGMGFLAQRSRAIHLARFNVALANGSKHVVTTVADAVHFSNCQGDLSVEDGLYENMLDDALNVHGSYLKVIGHPSPGSALLRFEHPQSFGFTFAEAGDTLQFVDAASLRPLANAKVVAVDRVNDKTLSVRFSTPLSQESLAGNAVMNLSWQPSIVYRRNHIRHNRARGILIGTAGAATVDHNFFDHLAGPAILMSADANFWYESAPAQNVTIRHNRFLDTNIADFGPASIWIDAPRSPTPGTTTYSIRNVEIVGNQFQLFQKPMLYAAGTENLRFADNTFDLNKDYPVWAQDAPMFSLRNDHCVAIQGGSIGYRLRSEEVKQQDTRAVHFDPEGILNDQPYWTPGCPVLP